jgi:hypothetical protein
MRNDESPRDVEAGKMRERIDKSQARQGVTGQGVRYVLAISLSLALIALMAIYFGMV